MIKPFAPPVGRCGQNQRQGFPTAEHDHSGLPKRAGPPCPLKGQPDGQGWTTLTALLAVSTAAWNHGHQLRELLQPSDAYPRLRSRKRPTSAAPSGPTCRPQRRCSRSYRRLPSSRNTGGSPVPRLRTGCPSGPRSPQLGSETFGARFTTGRTLRQPDDRGTSYSSVRVTWPSRCPASKI